MQMLDDVCKVNHRAGILILGAFNADTLKPHSCWDSAFAIFEYVELVTSTTQTTLISTSIKNNIYINISGAAPVS